jgi:hypothetical protein
MRDRRIILLLLTCTLAAPPVIVSDDPRGADLLDPRRLPPLPEEPAMKMARADFILAARPALPRAPQTLPRQHAMRQPQVRGGGMRKR